VPADEASPLCFICAKHRAGNAVQGGVLFEDDFVYAGHAHALTSKTAYRGYLVVEPKRHAPGWGDLTDEEAAALGRVVNRLARALKEVAAAEHVYSFVFGDGVPHLHVLVVPRYPGTRVSTGVPSCALGRGRPRSTTRRCEDSSRSSGQRWRCTDSTELRAHDGSSETDRRPGVDRDISAVVQLQRRAKLLDADQQRMRGDRLTKPCPQKPGRFGWCSQRCSGSLPLGARLQHAVGGGLASES
jgi:histidine triad (HIT) family protein